MEKLFTATTLEECLELASKELNVDSEKIIYKIVEEKKGFFRKSITISASTIEDEDKSEDENKNININGSIKVSGGKIIVKDPQSGGNPATVIPSKGLTLLVDGEEVQTKMSVYEKSNIEVQFPSETPSRELSINISDNKMEAYANINYKPQQVFTLEEAEEGNSLFLKKKISEEIWPPLYNLSEIKEQISKCDITYGIIEENLNKCLEKKSVYALLIAKGNEVVNGEDDVLQIKFEVDKDLKKLVKQDTGNIDFKSIGSVSAVHKGDVLAVRYQGKEGKEGKDVKGNVIRCKAGKKLTLKASQGCSLKDENTVIAAIDGKPCIKSNAFYVYQIHEVADDVDVKTGDIKFIGDIIIKGSVKEGMKVESGNSIEINRDVERAEIIGRGNISIKGNLIFSKVIGGGENVERLKYIEVLNAFNSSLKELLVTIEEVKKFNLLGYGTTDGKIIKVLIENKFKNIPKLCLSILTESIKNRDDNADPLEEDLLREIRGKLMGLSPINIKHYSELDLLLTLLDKKIEVLKNDLLMPVDVSISYSQDSVVKSSGNVYITGKGMYVSEIEAYTAIYFTAEKSVVRGGMLKAKQEIKCKEVGSTGGVSTKLIVNETGHIYANVAYQNTLFVVGNRESVLDEPAKDIHVYLDHDGEIVVDKFKL